MWAEPVRVWWLSSCKNRGDGAGDEDPPHPHLHSPTRSTSGSPNGKGVGSSPVRLAGLQSNSRREILVPPSSFHVWTQLLLLVLLFMPPPRQNAADTTNEEDLQCLSERDRTAVSQLLLSVVGNKRTHICSGLPLSADSRKVRETKAVDVPRHFRLTAALAGVCWRAQMLFLIHSW